MADEYTHPDLDFTHLAQGDDWYQDHQDFSTTIQTLLKHTRGDGEAITAPALRADPVTMYVRATGDDTNDGLTSTEPKATVTAALEDAFLHADLSEYVVIDLGDGTFDNVNLYRLPMPVLVRGNGPANTTIRGDGASGAAIGINQSVVILQDLEIDGDNANQWCVTTTNGAIARMDNVDIRATTAGIEGIGVWLGSFCRHENGEIAVPERCIQVRGGHCASDNTTFSPGGDASIVTEVRESATLLIDSCTMNGAAGSVTGMDVQNFSYGQFRGGGSASELTQLMQARYGGFAEYDGTTSLTNVDHEGRAHDGGMFADGASPSITSAPRGTSDPDMTNKIRGTGGEFYFNTDTNTMRVYDGSAWSDM